MTAWSASTGERAPALGAGRQDARFVDRLVEQQRILRAVTDARRQHGSVLLVTGETGVGKTRLCAELLARQRRSRALLLEGAPAAGPQQPALAAVADSLRSADAGVGARVWPTLGARASRLSAVLPELAREGGPAAGADDPLVFRDLLEAVAEAAGDAPVIWLLDDMQRADMATWHFLWYLCRHVAGRRFLALASCRDDVVASAQGTGPPLLALSYEQGAIEVHLDRLGPADTGQLARSLLGTDLSSEAVDLVVERSAGNPRAAIELSQAAAAGRPNRLPPSVRHTVAVRVSTLGPAAGGVLEALGILEPEPDLQLVLALPEATDAALVELTEAGLVHVSGDQRGTVVRFRHPLYRDATRERTTWARRRVLHAQVADVLERMRCGRDVAAILRTARHRELGGEAERAVDYLGAAAGALRAAGDARAAGDLFLATLQTLVRNPGLAGSRSGVLLSAMQELSLAGRWIEVLPIAERVWPIPSGAPDGEGAQLAAVLGTSLLMTGRMEEANALLARQVSQLEGAGRSLAAPSLLAAAAAAALHEGHLAKAQRLCQLAARTREPGVRGFARCLAVAVRFRSDRDRTAAAAEFGALSHAVRADGLTELAAFARWNQARMTTRMEDALRVEAMGERAYPLMAAPARLVTATIHLLEGRESRAGAALDQARSELSAAVPLLTPLVDGLQAHVDLHLGEVERARRRLEPWGGERADVRSLARAVVLGAQGWLAWETDSLEVAAERFRECADECAASGYGLLESGSPLLPLHVDALLRLGSAGEARRAVQAAAAGGGTDRFSRAALAAGRFRLSPSAQSWDEAREVAAAAPWPLLEAQLGCWCAEHLGSRSAGEAAVRLASAIGARRWAERTRRVLAALSAVQAARSDEGPAPRLSLRELQVAALVADGLSNPAIAHRLNVSVATVTTHVKHILAKLGFRSRAQVAAWVSQQRLHSWENEVLLRMGRKALS